jgi:hypothetical protein
MDLAQDSDESEIDIDNLDFEGGAEIPEDVSYSCSDYISACVGYLKGKWSRLVRGCVRNCPHCCIISQSSNVIECKCEDGSNALRRLNYYLNNRGREDISPAHLLRFLKTSEVFITYKIETSKNITIHIDKLSNNLFSIK